MVDNTKPTEQFHAYEAPDAIPVADRPVNPVVEMLSKFGISRNRVDSIARGSGATMTSARAYAQNNPGKVLGGLAALVIGAGLLRKRSR